MANIFEELMQSHMKLTEGVKPQKRSKQSRCECKKISCKKFRLESLKIFEDVDLDDLDELDAEFAVDPEDSNEDEVVLIIDPELPMDEEVPEDAAEQIVGDYVYKCSVCGANYVCDPESENEFLSVDENGVPIECPVCGDDSEQILVGEIAPATAVEEVDKETEEHEMEPVEVEEEEEETEVIEDSLKAPKRVSRGAGRGKTTKESVNVDVTVNTEKEIEDEFKDEYKVDDTFELEAKRPMPRKRSTKVNKDDAETEGCTKKLKESDLGTDVDKYQKWVDYDMKHYKKISKRTQGFLDKAGLEVVKDDHGDYEVIAKSKKEACKAKTESRKVRKPITKVEGTRRPQVSASRINRTRAIKEAKTRQQSNVKKSSRPTRPYIFKEEKLESMMTKMIRENYKTKDSFKVTRAFLENGKLNLNYTVGKRKGTFVAEGFDKKTTKMSLKIKDKGVFTESFTKTPSFIVECVCVNQTVIPMRVRYNFVKKVNESYYRVRGEAK